MSIEQNCLSFFVELTLLISRYVMLLFCSKLNSVWADALLVLLVMSWCAADAAAVLALAGAAAGRGRRWRGRGLPGGVAGRAALVHAVAGAHALLAALVARAAHARRLPLPLLARAAAAAHARQQASGESGLLSFRSRGAAE